MKKLLSIVLTLLVIMSAVPMAFAGELTELEITSPRTENVVSWYSNYINNERDQIDMISKGAGLRLDGEWAGWDISSLAEGTYSLEVDMAAPYNSAIVVHVYVDGVLNIVYNNTEDYVSGWTGVTRQLGSVDIYDGAKELKIKNDSLYANVEIQRIKLVRTGDVGTASKDIEILGVNTTSKENYEDDVVVDETTGEKIYPSSAMAVAGEDYYISGSYAYGSNYYWTYYILPTPTTEGRYVTPSACLRNGDWARYSVEGMRSGTYQIGINAAASASSLIATFTIDGKTAANGTVTGTGSYSTYGLTENVCKIYIPEGAKYLTVSLGNSAYVNAYNFKYISEDDTTDVFEATYSNIYTTNKDTTYLTVEDDYTKGNYYDGAKTGLQTDGGRVVLYGGQGEWVKYDISTIPNGIYTVSATANVKTSGTNTEAGITVKTINALGEVLDEGEIYFPGVSSTYTTSTQTYDYIKITPETTHIVFGSGKAGTVMFASYGFKGAFAPGITFTADSAGENAIDTIGENKTVYAQVDLASSAASQTVTVIVAVYDGEELVSAVPDKNIFVAKSGEVEKTYSVSVESGQTVKVLVWDNLENISPMSGASVIE